jgi:hypothetical protein
MSQSRGRRSPRKGSIELHKHKKSILPVSASHEPCICIIPTANSRVREKNCTSTSKFINLLKTSSLSWLRRGAVNELKFIQLSYPELKRRRKKHGDEVYEVENICAHGRSRNNQIYNLVWMGLKIAPHGRAQQENIRERRCSRPFVVDSARNNNDMSARMSRGGGGGIKRRLD